MSGAQFVPTTNSFHCNLSLSHSFSPGALKKTLHKSSSSNKWEKIPADHDATHYT